MKERNTLCKEKKKNTFVQTQSHKTGHLMVIFLSEGMLAALIYPVA